MFNQYISIMKKVLFLSALAALFTLAACQEKETIEDSVTLSSPASVNVPVEGDIVTIAFNSSVAWTAASDASWLTLSAKAGESGDASIKASAAKNDTNDSRSAKVTITAGTKSAVVTVTQDQLNALNIEVTSYEVPQEGGTVEIAVKANVDYTVSIPEAIDWVKNVSTKGLVDSKILLEVSPSHETEERVANITISAGDLSSGIKITQAAFVPYFDYEGDWAGLQWSFYEGTPTIIPQEGADITIDVSTNIEWRAYFSVWDNDAAAMVDSWDLGWARLSYTETQIHLVIDANESYFPRENYLYSECTIDGKVSNEYGGLGWFRQEGLKAEGAIVELQWQKSLADMGIPAGYNRLAYTKTGALLVSDGEKVHAISPADGTYWKSITYPGIAPTSIDSDDAGNIVVASDLTAEIDWGTGALTSGTEFTIYYSADPNTLNNSIVVENKDYGVIGGIRVRGNLAEKAVITGVAGSASCWFGYDIENYAAVPNYYGTQNQGPGPGVNAFWDAQSAASVSIGTSLHDGVLFRGYDGKESLYYLKDAYTPNWAVPYEWKLITDAGNGGNENQNNIDIVDYNGKKIVAFTQGFHFSYSSNAMIYILDVTDIDNVSTLATVDASEWLLEGDWSGANSADVLLHVADDALELYAVQSGKNTLAKFSLIIP